MTMSPSSRGPAAGPSPSAGKESTAVGPGRPRNSRLSDAIRSASTYSTATWPASTPAEAKAMPTIRSTSGRGGACGPPSPMTSTSSTALRSAAAGLLGGRAQLRRGALGVLVVGLDDPLHEAVAHDVGAAEADELDALDGGEDLADHHEPRALVAREVDLRDVAGDDHLRVEAQAREEHLHLLGARVLRLVEDHERVVERAPAHEGQRRHLDDVALEVGGHLVGVDHVVQRVEQRPQVRIDLGHQVAGQEAQPLPGLDRGAGEDDPVDLAAAQRRGGHGHRQEGLAGAGRADSEGDRVAPDRVDVALLVDRLGGDPRRAMAPDDVLEDLGGRLVLVERVGHRGDRPLGDLVALLDEVRQLAHDDRRGGHRLRLAVEGDDVAAQEQLAVDVALEGAQDLVVGAAQRGGDLVGELELAAHQPRSASCASADTRLPSARPSTRAIDAFMTWPMSLGELAPVSATASATIARSSSSESSAGR